MLLSTGTPKGHSDPGPFEILLYPVISLLLAGLIAGLVAAVSVKLVRPWTGAGLRPPQTEYAPWRRLRAPVGFSVLGAVCVSISGLFPVLGGEGSTDGAVLRVLVVGVLLGVTLYWVHFGAADREQRRAGRFSYGLFTVIWTVAMTVYVALL